MKIFITGAGLIGCHSANELVQRGHNVTLFDINPNQIYMDAIAGKKRVRVQRGDLLNLPALLRAMKTVNPAVVVHSAGFIGSQVANPPYRGIRTNILGSVNTFEAAQLTGVKRIVHVSTFGVYDWDHIKKGPVTEDFPRWATQFYQATKVANELLLGAYKIYYGLETVVIRPASVYGPGHYRGGSGGGKNMAELARSCLGNGAIELHEKRIGSNDFVYAKDVGRGIALACVAKGAAGKTFNIGTGETYTPKIFAK
jgi:UDP-glucose 4-epimerase